MSHMSTPLSPRITAWAMTAMLICKCVSIHRFVSRTYQFEYACATLKRKHLCTCRSRYICMYVSRLMVCMSKLIPVCHSDIPSGKVPHDCFHLLDCPYVFMSAGQVKVTSNFIHTHGGFSLSVYIFFSYNKCPLLCLLQGGIYQFSLFHISINDFTCGLF